MTEHPQTTLGLEQQARDALANYELPRPAAVELLGISENIVFRVDFAQRAPVVVRLHSLGYHSAESVASELCWVGAVCAGTDVVTAPVVPARDGQAVVTARQAGLPDRHAVVFEFLDGSAPGRDSLTSHFEVLGATTARLHQHAARWQPPARFHRLRWDVEGTLGPSPHWGRWQDNPHLTPAASATLDRAAELVTARLARYGQSAQRFGLIHADLRLANLLVDGPTVAVIDFDDCGFGWYLYDLASAITFIEDQPEVTGCVQSWLAGYQRVRALGAADLAELDTFMILRRLVILAWLGSRPHTVEAIETGAAYLAATVIAAQAYLRRFAGPGPEAALSWR